VPVDRKQSRAEHQTAAGVASLIRRVVRAWGTIGHERRLAATAAIAMALTMFLPWYSKTSTFVVHGQTRPAEVSLTAFQAFSFVEAAVLLVSAALLTLLFARAEQRPFHLPGGDGLIIMAAGGWAGLLIFYRLLDKPTTTASTTLTTTVGVKWGIFFALLAAILLAYAGARVRAVERPEPPLERRAARTRPDHPTEQDTEITEVRQARPRRPEEPREHPTSPTPSNPLHAPPARSAPREPQPREQLSLEDEPPYSPPSGE
jgi:hypothetical protein